jgi:hypothetical protein
VLGVVAEADRAHLNSAAVSEGATVYDGDHFSTEAGGMLLLHGGATTLDLAEESAVIVRSRINGGQGMEAELRRGTLLFSAARAAALEIAVLESLICPAEDARTIGQGPLLVQKNYASTHDEDRCSFLMGERRGRLPKERLIECSWIPQRTIPRKRKRSRLADSERDSCSLP